MTAPAMSACSICAGIRPSRKVSRSAAVSWGAALAGGVEGAVFAGAVLASAGGLAGEAGALLAAVEAQADATDRTQTHRGYGNKFWKYANGVQATAHAR